MLTTEFLLSRNAYRANGALLLPTQSGFGLPDRTQELCNPGLLAGQKLDPCRHGAPSIRRSDISERINSNQLIFHIVPVRLTASIQSSYARNTEAWENWCR